MDREKIAMDRLRCFDNQARDNHPNGYAVMDSGGKDSSLIKELAYQSGVKFEIIHSHTTADHPITVRYVREEQERWRGRGIPYTIVYPTYKGKRTSLWELIANKGAPTRFRRWCCGIIKEQSAGAGRFTVTGVRWAESVRRRQKRAAYELPSDKRERINLNNDNDARRLMLEHCVRKGQFVINPVIDFGDGDVWEYITKYRIPYNPLYDMGYTRVGCVGCPMSSRNADELEKMPKFRAMYIHAFDRYIKRRPDLTHVFGWKNGQDLYDWWISHTPGAHVDSRQLSLFDLEEDGDDQEQSWFYKLKE